MNPWVIIGLAVALSASAFQGYRYGYNQATVQFELKVAEAQRVAFKNAELASRKEEARLVAEKEYNSLVLSLEDEANADADANRVCLGANGVRRLNLR